MNLIRKYAEYKAKAAALAVFLKYILPALLILFVLYFGTIIILTAVSSALDGSEQKSESFIAEEGTAKVSPQVERYRPLFEEYAAKYGVEEYTELLMAKTMQESGGRYADVMQSSESLGLPRNTISSPERSIDQGIKYFSEVLEQANGDVKLTLQAYNFGTGFINYAEEHNNGEYSKELAEQFASEKEAELGWSNYGDTEYVDHVMRYVDGFSAETRAIASAESGNWAMPVENVNVTSEYGMRFHPIDNTEKMHNGIDFACTRSDTLYAVKDGVIDSALHENTGLGNHLIIQHGEQEYSVYGHMSQLDVQQGDTVEQGQALGKCGTTGSSTGTHLHLEYRSAPSYSSDRTNPRDVLNF